MAFKNVIKQKEMVQLDPSDKVKMIAKVYFVYVEDPKSFVLVNDILILYSGLCKQDLRMSTMLIEAKNVDKRKRPTNVFWNAWKSVWGHNQTHAIVKGEEGEIVTRVGITFSTAHISSMSANDKQDYAQFLMEHCGRKTGELLPSENELKAWNEEWEKISASAKLMEKEIDEETPTASKKVKTEPNSSNKSDNVELEGLRRENEALKKEVKELQARLEVGPAAEIREKYCNFGTDLKGLVSNHLSKSEFFSIHVKEAILRAVGLELTNWSNTYRANSSEFIELYEKRLTEQRNYILTAKLGLEVEGNIKKEANGEGLKSEANKNSSGGKTADE